MQKNIARWPYYDIYHRNELFYTAPHLFLIPGNRCSLQIDLSECNCIHSSNITSHILRSSTLLHLRDEKSQDILREQDFVRDAVKGEELQSA